MEFKRGRPVEISKEKCDLLIAGIKQNLPYEMCAWKARIAESTLYEWLRIGKEDKEKGINSMFVQLSEDLVNAEAMKVAEHLQNIEGGDKSSKGRMWILERRWRKYFGQDSLFYQELLERASKIEEAFKRLMETNLQGAQINGQKVDPESN